MKMGEVVAAWVRPESIVDRSTGHRLLQGRCAPEVPQHVRIVDAFHDRSVDQNDRIRESEIEALGLASQIAGTA
jgi:hypothetical protein